MRRAERKEKENVLAEIMVVISQLSCKTITYAVKKLNKVYKKHNIHMWTHYNKNVESKRQEDVYTPKCLHEERKHWKKKVNLKQIEGSK